MKSFQISLIAILIMVPFSRSLATQSDSSTLNGLIQQGKQKIYHFQLDEALEIFSRIQNEYPDKPHGFFYTSYLYAIFYSQDRTNRELDSLLLKTIKQATETGENYKQKYPKDPEAHYYLGVSNGVLGIYHVLNSNYLKGYIHGRRAKNHLEDAVEIDSTCYDAYLGLGIFHYYVDLLPGIVRFFAGILGFHGDRSKGMEEIGLTLRQGQFFRAEAEFVYAVIRYFLEGDYHGGLNTFLRLHRLYPMNPAMTLLIGYHYRRHGQIEKAKKLFESVREVFSEKLPQITVMKYYNLGVCYFRLNDFSRAEDYFNELLDTSLRKSPYYQAALAYYKGLLAGLNFRQKEADYFLSMIYKNRDTEYWYNMSRLFIRYPFDSLMVDYVIAENYLYTFNYQAASVQIPELIVRLEKLEAGSYHPDLPYLIKDLEARMNFQGGQVNEARGIYQSFIEKLNELDDDFQKAWIYIAYARVLRELKEWEKSEEMLKKADSTDDEYTRIIIEREKYILKNLRSNKKT
ncbi:MAG: DUF3808 domain-containing protein [Calditrichaeota bacterium]|nr:DUF3808 domain-containing protein [Calditrichota bacterium]RQW07041.1 MAG: DUF3808 domain-containing protein [Calditrichota bacterium]